MYIYSCSRSLITARVARRAAMFSSLSVCLSVCLFPYLLQSLTLLFSSLFVCLLLHYLSSSATLLFCPVLCFVCLIQRLSLFLTVFFNLCQSVCSCLFPYLAKEIEAEYIQSGVNAHRHQTTRKFKSEMLALHLTRGGWAPRFEPPCSGRRGALGLWFKSQLGVLIVFNININNSVIYRPRPSLSMLTFQQIFVLCITLFLTASSLSSYSCSQFLVDYRASVITRCPLFISRRVFILNFISTLAY